MTATSSAPATRIERARSVMWVGNVRALPFAEQVRTAALAGFGGISVTPLGVAQALTEGLSTADIRAVCAEHGITRIHLDPLARWTERWRPENLDPAVFPLAFFAFTADDFLRFADGIGATSMTAIATFPQGAVGIDRMTADFAALCDRAAGQGMDCALEFIPLDWGVPDLETAWTIVRDGDRPNSGIVIDSWCFERGGSRLETLRAIPGEKIAFVQLADGLARVPEGRSRIDDNLGNRLPPGLGEFDVTALLRALAGIGGLSSVAPELFAWQLDALPPETIAAICRSSLAEAADRAGIAHDLPAPRAGWRAAFEDAVAPAPTAPDAAAAPARSHI